MTQITMDFEQLSALLRDALANQNSVSLPGIGTFSAEDEPASFSDRGYTVNPPYRKLSFTPGKGEDAPLTADGLEDCLKGLDAALKSERSVELEGLGKLRLTSKGDLFFVPDPEPDIFPDGFGLEPVSMKAHSLADSPEPQQPAEQPTPQPAGEPAERPAPQPEPQKKTRRKAGRFLLWLVLLLLVAAAAFRAAAILAPDFIDSLLYTPEELQLLGK